MECTCIGKTWCVSCEILSSFPVYTGNLTCQVNGGVVSCPPVACPGDQVTLTGTVPAVNNNIWLLPSGSCSGSNTPDSIVLSQSKDTCKDEINKTCGPYTATNVDPGSSTPCLTSTLTVRVNTGMTSSLIMVGSRSINGSNSNLNTTQIIVIDGKTIHYSV